MATEWPAGLDVADLLRRGWRPAPFRQFVVKLHGRCNLACDYCYMFHSTDQGWRSRPAVMSRAVADQICARIAEHCAAHDLPRVAVVLHGGEPLLAGATMIGRFAVDLRRALTMSTAVDLSIQTNGILLDERMLDVLAEAGCRVGVSLDGDRGGHDRHRTRTGGQGSYDRVMRGIRLLAGERYRPLFAGLLCTVDLANDPLRTYEALLESAPPLIDFLLPHGNWSNPPPGRTPGAPDAPYGSWLAEVFDHWYSAPRRAGVRLFDETIQLLLGGWTTSEVVGLSPYRTLVIETDGALEQVDTLRSAYPDAAATGYHISSDPLDAALTHPALVARQIGAEALSAQCQRCPLRNVCGGGCYPHRYQAGAGFRNPSVYCADLSWLIRHIQARLSTDLARLTSRGAERA